MADTADAGRRSGRARGQRARSTEGDARGESGAIHWAWRRGDQAADQTEPAKRGSEATACCAASRAERVAGRGNGSRAGGSRMLVRREVSEGLHEGLARHPASVKGWTAWEASALQPSSCHPFGAAGAGSGGWGATGSAGGCTIGGTVQAWLAAVRRISTGPAKVRSDGPDTVVTGLNLNVVEGMTRYSLRSSRARDPSERLTSRTAGFRGRDVGAGKRVRPSSFRANGSWM